MVLRFPCLAVILLPAAIAPQQLCSLASPSNPLHPKLVIVKMNVQDVEWMHVLLGQGWEQELMVQLTLLELLWQCVT